MNAEFVNPFISALKNVLLTMAQTDLKAGKPAKKSGTLACGEVSGLIGMQGPQLNGSLSITFDQALALEVMSKMLGEKPLGIDDEVADMVGEIVNMVCGGAKNELAGKGYEFGMASPVLLTGKDHSLIHNAKGPHVVVPLSNEIGKAYIEFCFDR